MGNASENFEKQRFKNGEVHDWYRIILGYSDHLVGDLIDRFGLTDEDSVLDPFCGTGTTLVECMKRGIPSIGIDANPSSYFAAQVKTNWTLKPKHLLGLLDVVVTNYRSLEKCGFAYLNDPTSRYLAESGMLKRGWVSREPLRKTILLKHAITMLSTTSPYKRALMLALTSEFVSGASNVKFGPELYCGPKKSSAPVLSGFKERVRTIANDLEIVQEVGAQKPLLIKGDSRMCAALLKKANAPRVSAIITSPPYPTEHDYTRNSRLELALLEAVLDLESLRSIKKGMIRSHTKGIYIDDEDSRFVANHVSLRKIIRDIDDAVATKTHGFAKLYSKVITEYFGGMLRHLRDTYSMLLPGAPCAYIVGDQASYARVHIPTAEILGILATEIGFEVDSIETWRTRWSTTTSRTMNENILFLRKPRGAKRCQA